MRENKFRCCRSNPESSPYPARQPVYSHTIPVRLHELLSFDPNPWKLLESYNTTINTVFNGAVELLKLFITCKQNIQL